MGGFSWRPGAQARLAHIEHGALAKTAQDIVDDLESSGTLPYAGPEYANRGALQRSTQVHDEGGMLQVVTSFFGAKRMYLHPEFRFNREHNANAGGKWFEPYKRGGAKAAFVSQKFAGHMRGRLR